MTATEPGSEEPASLLGITIRRSIASGRLYLIYASGMLSLIAIALSFASRASFSTGFPIFLPLFGVVGAMGGLVVFTNDRVKGVFEYLLAYGVSPRRLFWDVLVASLVLETIVLGTALTVGLGVYVARGRSIPASLLIALALYAIPMSYSSVAFATSIGMFWTTLSSPREGLNSPTGLAPFIGIAPSLIVLIAIIADAYAGGSDFVVLIGVAVGAVVLIVVLLLSLVGRLLRRERLLSPA